MSSPTGSPDDQTDPHRVPDDERVADRSHLLPEEREAGSDDPQAQAAAILAESDERTAEPGRTQAESSQTNESA